MGYSFTERKRIRKDFSKRPTILEPPFLLATQIESFKSFLQESVPVSERDEKGLHGAFLSARARSCQLSVVSCAALYRCTPIG